MYTYPDTGINILAGTLYGLYPYLLSWHSGVSFCSFLLSLTTRLLYSNPTFNFPRLSAGGGRRGQYCVAVVVRWQHCGHTRVTAAWARLIVPDVSLLFIESIVTAADRAQPPRPTVAPAPRLSCLLQSADQRALLASRSSTNHRSRRRGVLSGNSLPAC